MSGKGRIQGSVHDLSSGPVASGLRSRDTGEGSGRRKRGHSLHGSSSKSAQESSPARSWKCPQMKNFPPGTRTDRRNGLPKHTRLASALSSVTMALGVRARPRAAHPISVTEVNSRRQRQPCPRMQPGSGAERRVLSSYPRGKEQQEVSHRADSEPLKAFRRGRSDPPQRGYVPVQLPEEHAPPFPPSRFRTAGATVRRRSVYHEPPRSQATKRRPTVRRRCCMYPGAWSEAENAHDPCYERLDEEVRYPPDPGAGAAAEQE